ncbi:MAG: MFS transporter [Acidobacteriota bacterium]|nr:MFS transporter [Acidobacteriota bacterium]
MTQDSTAGASAARPLGRGLNQASILLAIGVFATSMAQPQVLGRLPLQNLLKNELHVDRTMSSAFFFWAGLAWYFKPLIGVVTDAYPMFGSRRRSYLTIFTLLATLSWLALVFLPHHYHVFLVDAVVTNAFMVVASTVIGAYMVEAAQATGGSGRLSAVRQLVQQGCFVILGPIAGFLASIKFGWTAGACAGTMFLLFPATLLLVKEQRQPVDGAAVLRKARQQILDVAQARTMWAAAGLMALYYLAPGLTTAIFYRQQNVLHMNTQQQGFLVFLTGSFGVAAAIAYGYLCRRLALRTLLFWSLTLGTAVGLLYLDYTTIHKAQMMDSLNGFISTLVELALMDLAVRSTPAGSEGMGFALMMSVRNFALYGTDWFGSRLLDKYHYTFNSLVLLNALTTLLAVPCVFLLSRRIVMAHDAQPPAMVAAPETVLE